MTCAWIRSETRFLSGRWQGFPTIRRQNGAGGSGGTPARARQLGRRLERYASILHGARRNGAECGGEAGRTKSCRGSCEKIPGNQIVLASADSGAEQAFSEISQLQDSSNPYDPFALHKAALIACGIIPYREQISVEEVTKISAADSICPHR